MRWSLFLLLGIVLTARAEEEVPAAVHVHTTWSGGALSIRQVAEQARESGLRAVVLSDGYNRTARWGPPPLHGLVHWTRDRPSVRRADIEAWLAEIEAASNAVPEVAIVPGLELSPVCEWSGAPWTGGLRAEGLHVHLLALGSRPAGAFRELPSRIEGPLHWSGARARRCALALAAAIGAFVFLRGRARWFAAAGILLAGAWLPWSRDVPSYTENVVEAASRAGFVTSWAHPEALFPAHETDVEGVRVRTLPYPDRVVLSDAAAFPALYGDARTAEAPGREWDRALLDYVQGRRPAPIWGIGEADFDGSGLVALDTWQTVFLVAAPGVTGVERALASGACYAAYAPGGRRVSIAFSVIDPASGSVAGMGDTLVATGPVRVRAEARGDPGEATIAVLLNGRPWKEAAGPLPLVREIELLPARGRSYLRMTAMRDGGGGALSNPIFLER